MPTLRLRCLAVLALTAPLAAPLVQAQEGPAQDAPASAVQPYIRLSAGGGVVSNEYDYGTFELVQNAGAVGGAVEAGIQRRTLTVGIELAALRSGRDSGGLPLLLARSQRTVASRVSAAVVTRTRFSLGPVAMRVGTGIGVGRTVGHLDEVRQIRVVGGIPVGEVERRHDVRLRPLFSSDVTMGREIGSTFVGLGLSAATDYSADAALRYGLVFERTF